MKRLYLIDVSSIIFRAFYAIRNLRTSKGLPTNAVYGFVSMTVKLLKSEKPDYIAYCCDRPEPSFRVEIDQNYKANRQEFPEELSPQMPYIEKLNHALGIPRFSLAGYEADDIIGTLVEWGKKNNIESVIVSGDKDFAQLLGPGVSILDTMKDLRITEADAPEKWGVKASQFIDYLALVGDSSDNVPGVRGIGPKGAQKLLSEFESLDQIYANAEKIKNPTLRTKLIEGKDSAYMSRRLVTICKDVPLQFTLEALTRKPINRDETRTLLEELEFGNLQKSLLGDTEAETPSEVKPTLCVTVTNEITGKFKEQKTVSAEELAQLVPSESIVWAKLTDRDFILGYDSTVYHVAGGLSVIKSALNDKNLNWCGYDVKKIWRELWLDSGRCYWDPMLASYLLRPGENDDFDRLYQKYSGKKLPDFPTPLQCLNAEVELQNHLSPYLREGENGKLLHEIDFPLASVLYAMERTGVLIDREELGRQSQILGDGLRGLETEIYALAGNPFNILSPKQLGHILFDKLGLPVIKKTKTGYSTDSDVLAKLIHPICGKILEYRELTKLKSTYVDALPTLIDERTGRVHTHFHQALTATGRLSSQNPNLQNIPIRTERGSRIRKAFIANSNNQLVAADYSQIELRILAHVTNDPALVASFLNDEDIHSATAREIFSLGEGEVSGEHRRIAKAVNFGIAYGQGAFGLAETLDIPRTQASDIINRYFSRYKKVNDYIHDTIEQAKNRGYVESMFGRKRYLPEIQSKNRNIQKFGERAAINAPMQGAASDIVKKAMIQLFQNNKSANPYSLLLQVHDELLFESARNVVKQDADLIRKQMEDVVKLNVPMKVNVGVGDNWDETKV